MKRTPCLVIAIALALVTSPFSTQAQQQPPGGGASLQSRVAELEAKVAALEAAQSGNTLWAVVNSNGTLRRGKGVVMVQPICCDNGVEVHFDQDVSQCAPVATVVAPHPWQEFVQGHISADMYPAQFNLPHIVYVKTKSVNGGPADLPFAVAVHC